MTEQFVASRAWGVAKRRRTAGAPSLAAVSHAYASAIVKAGASTSASGASGARTAPAFQHTQASAQASTQFGAGAPAAVALWFLVRLLDDWEPGLVAIVEAILEARTPRSSYFDRLKDGGRGLCVSNGGQRLTHTRHGVDWGVMWPRLRSGAACWHVAVHAGGDVTTIGVTGAAEPTAPRLGGDHGFRRQATAYGWVGFGGVYLAGQSCYDHGGWPGHGGWRAGDTAALRVDCAAKTVTLKHRRHGQSFELDVAGAGAASGVAVEWYVSVCLGHTGDSVEVRPMGHAEYDVFLA